MIPYLKISAITLLGMRKTQVFLHMQQWYTMANIGKQE